MIDQMIEVWGLLKLPVVSDSGYGDATLFSLGLADRPHRERPPARRSPRRRAVRRPGGPSQAHLDVGQVGAGDGLSCPAPRWISVGLGEDRISRTCARVSAQR
jgi:hypothetical protein